MVAFGHTAVGGIIGVVAFSYIHPYSDPVVGLLQTGAIGVISHYIMDFVPHGHFFREHEYKKNVFYVIVFDLFLSVLLYTGLSLYLSEYNLLFTLYVLFGIGGSQLPDIIDGLMYVGILPKKGLLQVEHDLHVATHWHGKREKALLWGWADLWQVSVFLIGVLVLFLYFR